MTNLIQILYEALLELKGLIILEGLNKTGKK